MGVIPARIGRAAACFTAAALIILFGAAAGVSALKSAPYPLQELADRADDIFIGIVEGSRRGDEVNDVYTFRVGIKLKGKLEQGMKAEAQVTQFGDEGVLETGKTYLVLLNKNEKGYFISGTHQGIVKLDGGTSESRYYGTLEVDRFLAQYALESATVQERLDRLIPDEEPPPVGPGGTPAAVKWSAGLVLAAMLAVLFLRDARRAK